VAVPLLLTYLGVRFLMTLVSYTTGAAGGIFAPLLVLGALGGLWFGTTVSPLVHASQPMAPQIYCVLGMGALFTAIVRAPLTGIVLMIDLTGEYGFLLPLLVACLLSYSVAEWMGNAPIYEALRVRGSNN
jgi:CIC family chloride channel protein